MPANYFVTLFAWSWLNIDIVEAVDYLCRYSLDM